MSARILAINGPLVTAELPGVPNGEQVRLGALGLLGEVIERDGLTAVIQVYESTDSLVTGQAVEALGHPLSVELGPGLLGNIFDGVQRPLNEIYRRSGDHIARGLELQALDRKQRWAFTPAQLQTGTRLQPGSLIGTVPETPTIEHRVLVPPGSGGELIELAPAGDYTVDGVIARLRSDGGQEIELRLHHRWPVRIPRPYARRDHAVAPLLTGQRILDTFFPLLKGGKAAVPGPFGAGKTMVQQQIARWANADIVIYVGCGERGNELVDVLESFPKLTDPHTGRSVMERTLLVANTSNMPVVAREASIYVGVTMAEYYRDQGYDVVMVADSTSRWAEALREVSGRLGQMPVEEGYPAYLASRLAAFYERAGRVETLSERRGSVTVIGAVSPPGGDFSEPVTSHTKEIIQTFWALSKELADARHYPAVSWTESFSDNVAVAAQWWAEQVDANWARRRADALEILSAADELTRIVNLVGPEALSSEQRWTLEMAAVLREAVLQQSALEEADSFASPQKQFALLDLSMQIHDRGRALLEREIPVQQLLGLDVLSKVRRLKSRFDSEQVDEIQKFGDEISKRFAAVAEQYESHEPPS